MTDFREQMKLMKLRRHFLRMDSELAATLATVRKLQEDLEYTRDNWRALMEAEDDDKK